MLDKRYLLDKFIIHKYSILLLDKKYIFQNFIRYTYYWIKDIFF